MRVRRLARRLAAAAASAALVLGQALVVAHACVLPAPAEVAVEVCQHEETPTDPSALCKAHCEAGQQTVDQPRPLATPDLGTPVLLVAAQPRHGATEAMAARRDAGLARGGAPPPLLLTGRLRI